MAKSVPWDESSFYERLSVASPTHLIPLLPVEQGTKALQRHAIATAIAIGDYLDKPQPRASPPPHLRLRRQTSSSAHSTHHQLTHHANPSSIIPRCQSTNATLSPRVPPRLTKLTSPNLHPHPPLPSPILKPKTMPQIPRMVAKATVKTGSACWMCCVYWAGYCC